MTFGLWARRASRLLHPAILNLEISISSDRKWMEVDSHHRSNLQQIYSLSPLATRESIREWIYYIQRRKFLQDIFSAFLMFCAPERVWKSIPAICPPHFAVYFAWIQLPQPATAPSSGQNLPQIVTHILQKAFFKYAPGEWKKNQ